ncbi:MAG: thioredoxin domain-containing protein [Novosphingobium sp.]|uniref:thioredoxin domain-containing protein n=1 Tax=Novosphingobium sp. TaxID=1874826 RepID=UPI003C7C87EC
MGLIRGTIAVVLLCCAPLAAVAATSGFGWNTTVTLSPEGGHVLGNPDAAIKVTEYASYSCHFCAEFANQSEGPLRIGYISSGKVSFEVRNLLLNSFDLPLAMLVECGPKERFFQNHIAFYRRQQRWMEKLQDLTKAQTVRWGSGTMAQRNRAIASDLQLYDIMESLGYDRMEVDKCLTDEAAATRIKAQSETALDLGVSGTPSFAINGSLMEDIHDWPELRRIIDLSN